MPVSPSSEAAATAQRLLGAWRLVAWTIDAGDGRPPSHPFGPSADGVLLYEPGGWMSATIAAAGRVPLSGGSQKGAPPVEQVAAYETFFSYAGTWTATGDTVAHTVTVASNPGMVGTVQRRDIAWSSAGELLLSASEVRTLGRRLHVLRWRREAGTTGDLR